ncbi:response regulator transcription factor [Candidatus Sumerlaeota bacterium]|nr:response regulator transcription factor [Candidatus Sumerlaeota bacterium]
MKVLLVEDSKRLQRAIGEGLRKSGYAVDITCNGEEGLWLAESNEYDVVILDLMLPGLDGLTVLRRLRDQGRQTHVLILTAKDTVEDRVTGLKTGADDYLTKPFAFDELLARVEALIRRKYASKNPKIYIGDLSLDTLRREVTRAGRSIALQPREYALLEYLALRAGQIVSRTEIEQSLYDDRQDLMSNVVDSAICSLRKKLHCANEPELIQTRRGMGYLLTAEES